MHTDARSLYRQENKNKLFFTSQSLKSNPTKSRQQGSLNNTNICNYLSRNTTPAAYNLETQNTYIQFQNWKMALIYLFTTVFLVHFKEEEEEET